LWFTFKQMLRHPGKSILDYIDGGRQKYQTPVSYFACSVIVYFLYVKYILMYLPEIKLLGLTKEDIANSTTMDLTRLFGLLFGMSVIGWVVCGLKWGVENKRSFNLVESIIVFSFIYGTNFFIDPAVVSIEVPLLKHVIHLTGSKKNIDIITDIPLIILIGYMAFDFCKKAKISNLRYCITLVMGFLYYAYASIYIEQHFKGNDKVKPTPCDTVAFIKH